MRLRLDKKISRLSAFATGSALLLSFSALLFYDIHELVIETDIELSTKAEELAPHLKTKMLSGNAGLGFVVMNVIAESPNIKRIGIYDAGGEILSVFSQDHRDLLAQETTAPALKPDGLHFAFNQIGLFRPLEVGDVRTGTIYIELNRQHLWSQLWPRFLYMSLVFAAALFIAHLIVLKTRSPILAPIHRLTTVAVQVARERNYSLRVQPTGGGLDKLVTCFNDILSHSARKAAALDKVNHHIEEQVRRRTKELEKEVLAGRRAQIAFEESQRKLSTLMSNLPGMAYRSHVNNFWEMEFVSDGVYALTGFKPSEIVRGEANSFKRLIFPDDLVVAIKNVRRSIRSRQHFQNTYRLKTKSGATKWVWEKGQGVFSFDKKLVAIEGFIIDITERKKAEKQLASYAQKLQASNRELEDFAHVASHDLQEPLRKVLTFGGRLKVKFGDKLGSNGLDYIDRMQNASERMQVLIEDLLTYARVTSKAQPFGQVDLARVAKEVLSDLEIRIEEVGAQVEVSNMPTIEADALQMRQLLQNLIGNALKFHRKGQRHIVKVHTETLAEHESLPGKGSGACRLIVADNGIGFDDNQADRIFGVFQRLHGRSDYEGTGVGLAVCKKIAERHGGNIIAKGEPDKGAKFIVTLPVLQSVPKVTRVVPPATTPKAEAKAEYA